VVAGGAILTQDFPENLFVAGVHARIIKEIVSQTQQKKALEEALRTL
ncbi:2,3,4,5-tetrahydropyridine-2,6-carboxylate N-succinyltransferase, partial [Streptococcus suis]